MNDYYVIASAFTFLSILIGYNSIRLYKLEKEVGNIIKPEDNENIEINENMEVRY